MHTVKLKFRVDASVKSLTEITREQARKTIIGIVIENDANTGIMLKHFQEPVKGLATVDYPLSTPDVVEVEKADTVGELLWDLAQGYKRIYDEEDATCKTEVVPVGERCGLQNRNKTDGIHGIWGHDIEDLYFEKIELLEHGGIGLCMGS
jgi:hypothetical protein